MAHAEDRRDLPPTPLKKPTLPDDLFDPGPPAEVEASDDLDLLRFPEWPKAEPTPDLDFGDWFPESDGSGETRALPQPRIFHVAPNSPSTPTRWSRHRRKLLVGLCGITVTGALVVKSDAISSPFSPGIVRASVSPVSPSSVTPEATPAPPTIPVPGETLVPQIVGPRASYSIALASYRGRALAEAHRDALAAAAPGHLFVLAPLMLNGQLFHRVLGGLAEGEAEMGAVVKEISTATGNPSSQWVVRETPLAFTIDEMAEGPAAKRRVSDLRELGIPAYVLGILYSDESTAHRVLAGAYADPSEAEYLGGILSDHELGSAELEPRVGTFGH